MQLTTIQAAEDPVDIQSARQLLRNYATHLAETADIQIPGYEAELATLPGLYAEPHGIILLARLNSQPVGCIAFRPLPDHVACEMKRLWVDPTARGHNLGLRLVETGIAWAVSTGYTAMYLDTVPAAMPHANALYERLGFTPVVRYNDNPVRDVVFFRLSLKNPR